MTAAVLPTFADDRQRQEALAAHWAAAGYERCEPPILQPAAAFFESGEDMRGRLYLTQGLDGAEFCLRPEYTIPVCRHYLASGDTHRPATYSYCGPVFRLRRDGPGEFVQAGIENFARPDREQADAEIVALSLEAAALVAPGAFDTLIGDAALFSDLLDGLGIPGPWRRRITRGLAQNRSLASVLDAAGPARIDHSGVLAALAGVDRAGARALVEDLLSIAGIKPVGGRSAGEIAERFLEQAALTDGAGVSADQRAVLEGFLGVSGPPDAALKQMRDLARAGGIGLDPALERFERRLSCLTAAAVDRQTQLRFAAGFIRNLDYYTGFVFEIRLRGATTAPPLVGGGRYDRLMSGLGAAADVPAVGAALWADRRAAASPATAVPAAAAAGAAR